MMMVVVVHDDDDDDDDDDDVEVSEFESLCWDIFFLNSRSKAWFHPVREQKLRGR